MNTHDSILVKYAEGKATNLGKAWNKTLPWIEFYTELASPMKTEETRAKFDEMSKDEQDQLKAVAGWISTAQCENNTRSLKNILPRNLLSLDLDYCSVELKEAIENGEFPLSRYESVTHSSRRHTERKPRLRQFYPLAREVNADEYHALVRIVSFILDGKREPIIQIDRVSARPAQMMFRPTISKDGDWFYHHQKGKLLDPDAIFDMWRKKKGNPFDLANLPLFDTETTIRKRAEKSENPLTKPGIIGAFCRAYTITEAMDKFIPGTYIPGDAHSGQPRFTYAGSTSSNGAIVYDDDLFLYSNHGHDPCCEMNVNAFDMVRLHKFGELDEGVNFEKTPVNKLPSFKKMMAFAKEDAEVKHELVSYQRAILAQFEDESDESAESEQADLENDLIGDNPPPKNEKKQKHDWLDELEQDKIGRFQPSIHNYNLILQNDPRLKKAICLNEFTGQINLCRTISPKIDGLPSKACRDSVNGDLMADEDDSIIRAILDAPIAKGGYGMQNHIGNLRDAVITSARNNPFHPVKNYLESLRWDQKNRLDTFLIRYLRLEDTLYNREVSRLTALASVARVYEPGHKFDYITILGGPQGIRKSTFIKEFYGQRWFGELDCKLDNNKEIMEQTPGKWGMEMPELDSMKKADAPIFKKFMRKQEYVSRMAYGHRATVMNIQFVCWGSTNETKYLRDHTGLRTFWPLTCGIKGGDHIDTEGVRAERDQVWAEALIIYLRMRQDMPVADFPDLPLTLSLEAEKDAKTEQNKTRLREVHEEMAERMLEAADEPIRLSSLLREYGDAETGFYDENGIDPDTVWVRRCAVIRRDLIRFAFGDQVNVLTDQVKKTNFDRAEEIFLEKWKEPDSTPRRKFKRLASGRWYTRKECSEEGNRLGYEVVSMDNDLDLIG